MGGFQRTVTGSGGNLAERSSVRTGRAGPLS
jgi:hypothetical protein